MSHPALVAMTISSRNGARSSRSSRPKFELGTARGRSVVVGQVEVRDAAVESAADDGSLHVQIAVVAEVVPQSQGDDRQEEAAPAGAAVLHRLVAVIGRGVGGHDGRA